MKGCMLYGERCLSVGSCSLWYHIVSSMLLGTKGNRKRIKQMMLLGYRLFWYLCGLLARGVVKLRVPLIP